MALVLGLGVAVLSAQSLAEVAKKEKERRGKTSTGTRTITDRELASSFGGLPSTSSTVKTPASGDGSKTEGTEGEGGATPAEDETKTPEYWQNRMKGSKEKIAKAEEALKADDWGDGQRVGVDPNGANNLGSRQQAEQQLVAARAELEAIRAEARRAGVPPGWVR
jgi:hypothetical protein